MILCRIGSGYFGKALLVSQLRVFLGVCTVYSFNFHLKVQFDISGGWCKDADESVWESEQ